MQDVEITMGLVLQGMNIKYDNYDDRRICQTKIFLLKELGTNLGYYFIWIKRIYSSELADDMENSFKFIRNMHLKGAELSTEVKNNIKIVNELVEDKPEDMNIVSWYELLADLVYKKNRCCNKQIDFSPEICQKALNVLKENGF